MSDRPTVRILVSFAYGREINLPRILEAAAGLPVELFADSGAYTVANSGGRIHLPDYAAWLHDLGPLVKVAANLDVIGDHTASQRNWEKLTACGLSVLPVFHLGSPWPVLEQMCAHHPYLALGNLPTASRGMQLAMRNLVRCFQIASTTGTVFHGFGLTHTDVLAALPFYSVDSSTWTQGARYGRFNIWDDRRRRLVRLGIGGRADLAPYREGIRAHGGDPDVLAAPGCAMSSSRDRATFDREKTMVYQVNIAAMRRMEAWLRHRHHVPAPNDHEAQGTCVYLAGTTTNQLLLLVDATRRLTAA